MKLLSKLFHNNTSKDNKTKIKSDDDFLNTQVLINGINNFVILISFTENYFHDMIEFLAVCTDINKNEVLWHGDVKYVHTSYDEETDNKDTHDDTIYIVHNRYYLLIGGDDSFYRHLFRYSDNLANSILMALIPEIVENRDPSWYKDLINDKVIVDKFKHVNSYDQYYGDIESPDKLYKYADAKLLMSKLPDCFTIYDILPIIWFKDVYESYAYKNVYNLMCKTVTAYVVNKLAYRHQLDMLNTILGGLIDNITYDTLVYLTGPKYKIEYGEAMPGDVTDESLDELFRQKYESVGVFKSNDVEYTDIDETLSDEPVYDGNTNTPEGDV